MRASQRGEQEHRHGGRNGPRMQRGAGPWRAAVTPPSSEPISPLRASHRGSCAGEDVTVYSVESLLEIIAPEEAVSGRSPCGRTSIRKTTFSRTDLQFALPSLGNEFFDQPHCSGTQCLFLPVGDNQWEAWHHIRALPAFWSQLDQPCGGNISLNP